MKAFYLLVLIAWIPAADFSAQNLPGTFAEAQQLLAEARTLLSDQKVAEAQAQAQLAYQFFKSRPEPCTAGLSEATFLLGRCAFASKEYEQARLFMEASLQCLQEAHPEGSAEEATVLIQLGRVLVRQDQYDAATLLLEKAVALQAQYLPQNHPDQIDGWYMLGRMHLIKSTYNDAIKWLEKAVTAYQATDTLKYTTALENLSEAYLSNGRFTEATTLSKKALALQQQTLPANDPKIAKTELLIGDLYKRFKKFPEALYYYQEALAIYTQDPNKNANSIAECYSNIGQIYLYQKQFDKALSTFLLEDSTMINGGEHLKYDYAYTCTDLGKVYLAMGNFPEALRWQQQAVSIAQAHSNSDNVNMATFHLYLGRAQSAMGQYPEAISSFQANEAMLFRLYGAEAPILYHSHGEMGYTYLRWFRKTGDVSLLEQSRQNFSLLEADIQYLMQTEVLPEAQQKLRHETLPYFERAIMAENEWLKLHPGGPDRAWQLSENMHSYLLFSATKEANARHFAGIPDTMLIQDSTLQANITALEKKRNRLIQKTKLSLSDSLIVGLEIQILASKTTQTKLRKTFEKDFPDYFNLKYSPKSATLSQTQDKLGTQQTLLEYFTGDSSIFVFVVQNKVCRLVELPRDFPLSNWVQDFREGISSYHTAEHQTPALYQKSVLQYADAGQKLYGKLIAPIAKYLNPELIIVPGDGLTNLPFEALLSAAPKDLSSFNTYPFLLRSHSVQYAYSATMLQQMTEAQHAKTPTKELLAFAPFFEEDTTSLAIRLQREGAIRQGFSALPYSGEEVLRAKKRYGGASDIRIGKAGTKEAFLEMASKYKIIHLATHGKADFIEGNFSFLAFSSSDNLAENGLLSVAELYNLPINADLVVLSACETGIGEQQRGEGVLSLARAFAYAGAKSIVASLWSVNDKSTMLIMDNFYAELKSGKAKNVALANAKLQYLEQNPGQSHPFFWAGFVGVGDLGTIKD